MHFLFVVTSFTNTVVNTNSILALRQKFVRDESYLHGYANASTVSCGGKHSTASGIESVTMDTDTLITFYMKKFSIVR